jgi:hypothetical protein
MAAHSGLRPVPGDYRAAQNQVYRYVAARLQTDYPPADWAHRWLDHWPDFPAGD